MKKLMTVMLGTLMGLLGCAQGGNYTTQDNAAFAETIANPAVQVVDVRTPGEYAEGHLPGAVNIDVQSADFGRKSAELDKTRPVAVYCRSGVRSMKAARRLTAQGYEVYNLKGGILEWDGPVVTK